MTAGRMDADMIHALLYAPTNLEQPEAERVQLHPDPPRLEQPALERVEQPGGGCVQQQAELIGSQGKCE